MDLFDIPKRRADYRLEMIDGELLLYHPSRTTILYCNQSASLIWQLCDGRHTVQEIVALLCDAYPESANTIVADVETTLRQFLACGAIVHIPGGCRDCAAASPEA